MPRVPLNDVRLEGDVAVLILKDRRGQVTGECRIDAADLPRVQALGRGFRTCTSSSGHRYAGYGQLVDGKYRMVMLHRLLLNPPADLMVDHISGDTLDNRRSNLRLATRAQNAQNSRSHKDGSSPYKGVSWHAQGGTWRATLRQNGRRTHLGLFADPADAARAYDAEARKRFGAFARLNFPDPAPATLTLTARLARPA